MRRARWQLAALALASGLAVALYVWGVSLGAARGACLVLAAAPLVMIGAPAALMAWATIRHGDPYDMTDRQR